MYGKYFGRPNQKSRMELEHTNKWSSERALRAYCNEVIITKEYFIEGYETEIDNFVKHYAEFIHSKSRRVPLDRALTALDKLLFEINKVYIWNNFDSEYASSSFSGC